MHGGLHKDSALGCARECFMYERIDEGGQHTPADPLRWGFGAEGHSMIRAIRSSGALNQPALHGGTVAVAAMGDGAYVR